MGWLSLVMSLLGRNQNQQQVQPVQVGKGQGVTQVQPADNSGRNSMLQSGFGSLVDYLKKSRGASFGSNQ